jgi:hypothetical protein
MNMPLDALLRPKSTVLVFVPSGSAIANLVTTGAFTALAAEYVLQYVVPAGTIPTSPVDIPPDFAVSCIEIPVHHRTAPHPPLPQIVALLNSVNPLFCLVATATPDVFVQDVVWACEIEKVACAVIQTEWSDVTGMAFLPPPRPALICWGQESVRHLKEVAPLDGMITRTIGAPHDAALRRCESRPYTAGEAGDRVLLLAGGVDRGLEDRLRQLLDEAVATRRLEALRIVYHDARVDDPTARGRLLSAADVVIGPPSSMLIDALLLAKPAMFVVADGGHATAATRATTRRVLELQRSTRARISVVGCDGVIEQCRRLLDDAAGDQDERRIRLARKIAVAEPGAYADRLASICREIVGDRAQHMRFKRAGLKRMTVSHTYGAHDIAAAYCDLQTETAVPGYWMHGWIPEYHSVHPVFVALHKRRDSESDAAFQRRIAVEAETTPQFVSRQDQADFLAVNGYKHVWPIGLPITYLPKPAVPRVSSTLLVLPPHGQKSHGPGDPIAKAYAELVADLRVEFERVVVGLTEDDFVKNEWAWAFERVGIEIVMTAQQSDPNTLARLTALLSAFEFVTTNGFGSQIAYAAYCGAKVSVFGPYANFSADRMATIDAIKVFPELLETAVALCSEEALRKQYPFLFVRPDRAEELREWGAQQIGESHRASPRTLREFFQWDGHD